VRSTQEERHGERVSKREFSLDITTNSSEVMRLLNILKRRKEKRDKKAWIPAGPLHRYDGYNGVEKRFY
jgi:hypothetical protein